MKKKALQASAGGGWASVAGAAVRMVALIRGCKATARNIVAIAKLHPKDQPAA